MKKIISVILVFLFLSSIQLFVLAYAEDEEVVLKTVETFADGSYGVTTFTVTSVDRATKTGEKGYTYYNSSNVAQWTVYIHGTYTYTGSSATCTAASTSYSINNNSWSVTKATASRSGATATGEFTVKRYTLGVVTQTINKTLTLTCSPTGVLS